MADSTDPFESIIKRGMLSPPLYIFLFVQSRVPLNPTFRRFFIELLSNFVSQYANLFDCTFNDVAFFQKIRSRRSTGQNDIPGH